MEYANAQNSKVGSLWQKGREISGLVETIGSKFMKSLPIIPATVVISTLAGMRIGKALGKSSDLNLNSAKDDVESDTSEIKELNNIVVPDKIVERLNVEPEDYDSASSGMVNAVVGLDSRIKIVGNNAGFKAMCSSIGLFIVSHFGCIIFF